MNQEKIGKFITFCRKEKKITQAQLSEQLGVTDRSVSNWETGKNMPDLSLWRPLCQILGITMNELLSGEKINGKKTQKQFEENMINTVDYSRKRIYQYRKLISLTIIIFGLFISLSAIMIFPSESSWSSIYSVFGILIFVIGLSRIISTGTWYKKLLFIMIVFISAMGILLYTDYIYVKNNKQAPRFRLETTMAGNVIYYDTLFYDVYRCHFDQDNEYWVISKNNHTTIEELLNYCK